MPAYASAADMISRKSSELLGDLVSDTGERVLENDLPDDPKMVAALAGASGDVEAACLAGERYSVTDLQNLTDNSLAYLKDIICDLTYARLLKRKATTRAEEYKLFAEIAEGHLESLRKGERVFNVNDAIQAGVPQAYLVTLQDYHQQGMIRDHVNDYYPNRILSHGD